MLIVAASSWAALAILLGTTDDDNAAYAITELEARVVAQLDRLVA